MFREEVSKSLESSGSLVSDRLDCPFCKIHHRRRNRRLRCIYSGWSVVTPLRLFLLCCMSRSLLHFFGDCFPSAQGLFLLCCVLQVTLRHSNFFQLVCLFCFPFFFQILCSVMANRVQFSSFRYYIRVVARHLQFVLLSFHCRKQRHCGSAPTKHTTDMARPASRTTSTAGVLGCLAVGVFLPD